MKLSPKKGREDMGTPLWQKVSLGIGIVAVSIALVGAGWYGASFGWLPANLATSTTQIGNGIHQGPQDGTGQKHGVNGTQPHLQQGDRAQQSQQGQYRGKGRGRMTHSADQ